MVSGIALGAFGAHGLKALLEADALAAYKTGVLYQLLHGVAFIALAGVAGKASLWNLRFMGVGVLLFSGSIYLLTAGAALLPFSISFAGPLTPIGGVLMILGWGGVLINTWRLKGV